MATGRAGGRGGDGVGADAAWTSRVRSTYLEVHEPLWRSILGWSGSVEVADEAVAEAFAQLLRRGQGGEEVRDPAAWVWRSAHRIASGELARRGDEAMRTVGLTLVDGAGGGGRRAGTHDEGVTASARAVIELLGSMSEQQRRCVVLVDLAGHTAVSAAEVLGTSPETVRTQLARARRRLRTELARPTEELP